MLIRPSQPCMLFVLTFATILLPPATIGWSQATAPAAADAVPDKPPLKPEELEAMLAPIALYPDSLLTQVLMASTYPLEVVQADRFAKAHKDLKDKALTDALEKEDWDASVKSLVNFPQVLAMMSEKLDMTIKIGDAFIAQQADVMNTVQKLRGKAKETGNLKTTEQQKVIVEAAPPPDTTIVVQQPPPAQIIKIEPAQPEVIYVPSYSPTVVYGAWPYPAYPPYPYYPPGYVASNVMSFGMGMAVGAAWGYAWGNCDWGHNDVDIDVDRNTNINNNIDRSKYKNEMQNRQGNRDTRQADRQGNRDTRQGNRQGQGQGRGQGSWSHNPSHRQGVPYRDQGTANRMGQGAQNRQAAQTRDQYRGRADAGRQDLARGGASDFRGNNPSRGPNTAGGDFNRGGAGAGQNRAGNTAAQNRSGSGFQGSQNRSGSSAANRSGSSRGSSFDGVDRGGSSARQSSQRGQQSRSSSSASRGGGGSRSSGGGSRGGGGGSRGGGGGGRGGGGGGRGRSDVQLKTDFASIDPQLTLARIASLPITEWSYIDDPSTRHIGPTAQDFFRAFGLGGDDKTITFLDEGGVALSAIQALHQQVREKDERIQVLEKEMAELKAQVKALVESNRPSAPPTREGEH